MRRLILIASLAALFTAGAASEAMAAGAKVTVKDSEYGRVLMNGGGKALYLFTSDTGPSSQCYGDCAEAWPPFLTKGKPSAGLGLKPNLLGTTRRDDGSRQVTYKGNPLYFYEHDRPGVILCQDVFEFGGTWLLVNKRGNAVR